MRLNNELTNIEVHTKINIPITNCDYNYFIFRGNYFLVYVYNCHRKYVKNCWLYIFLIIKITDQKVIK